MEIVVLDKVLQIDNGVWFLIFSVYLRVVRSLELQLFNYYLQWYSDTSNFLQFTNLHGLVALGNRLYWIYGTVAISTEMLLPALKVQEVPQHIWEPSKMSCFLQTWAQKPLHHEPSCHCSLPVLSQLSLATLSHRAVPLPLCLWPQTPVQRFLGN